jgi:methionine aminotransferase
MTSKLPNVGTTIFTVMSKLAVEHNAINLGQGFPGFAIDSELMECVNDAMHRGLNQYAPMPGLPVLREEIAQKINGLYGSTYSAETEITVTAGATQAIFTAITAFIHPSDEVILFAPAYDCYAPAIELNGGKCVWVDMHWPDYAIDWNKVKDSITSKTRMIIINTPHNPSGTIMTGNDLAMLESLVVNTDILVMSDEVYEHMVLDGGEHESVAKYPSLRDQSLLVYSFGKTFHATGWKMGYIVAPEKLMVEFRKVHQFNVFSCNSAMQAGLAEYMRKPERYEYLPDFFSKKRDYFLSQLEGSLFQWKPAAGTYFQVLNYSQLSREKDTDMAIRLTKEFGVASIPLSVFYSNDVQEQTLRFCFAKENDQLEKAAEILRSIR